MMIVVSLKVSKDKITMKCAACGETMLNKKGELDLRVNEKLYIVSNASFEECPKCGERVIAPSVSEEIFSLISSKHYSEKETKIPVVELATV